MSPPPRSRPGSRRRSRSGTAAAAALLVAAAACACACASATATATPASTPTPTPTPASKATSTSTASASKTFRPPAAVSRAYPLGCSSQLRSYYDYDSTSFPPPHLPPSLVRTADEFGLTRRLGAGKFSDVFEAVDSAEERRLSASASASDGGSEGKGEGEGSCQPGGDLGDESGDGIDPRSLVVIKCLKPVSERKVRRELLVLTHASSLPNLARLRGVVVPEQRGDEDPTRIRGGGGGAGAGAGAGSFVDALRGGGSRHRQGQGQGGAGGSHHALHRPGTRGEAVQVAVPRQGNGREGEGGGKRSRPRR